WAPPVHDQPRCVREDRRWWPGGSSEQGLEGTRREAPADVRVDEFVGVFADHRRGSRTHSVALMHEYRQQGAARRPAIATVGEPHAGTDVSGPHGRGYP